MIWLALLAIVLAYFTGAVSGGLLLGPLFGRADLRAWGSGNPGATNALRTGGRAYGLAVLIFDVLKGVVAAAWLPAVAAGAPAWLACACGAAAVLGHVYPVYYRFRGGKGAATLIGTLLCLAPLALLPGVLVWLLALVLTGYMGASILLAMTAVAAALTLWHWPAVASPPVVFAAAMWALMLFTHRSNIARMLAGAENRFERVMLLRKSR